MSAPKTAIQQMLPPTSTVIAEELGECKKQGKQGNGIGPRQLRCIWKEWIQWAEMLASSHTYNAKFLNLIPDLCGSDCLLRLWQMGISPDFPSSLLGAVFSELLRCHLLVSESYTFSPNKITPYLRFVSTSLVDKPSGHQALHKVMTIRRSLRSHLNLALALPHTKTAAVSTPRARTWAMLASDPAFPPKPLPHVDCIGTLPQRTPLQNQDRWLLHLISWRQRNLNKQEDRMFGDFHGGPVVRNHPAHAGDTGSIPSSGRSHVPQNN